MEFKMCPIQIRLHKLEEMSEMINFVSKVERRVLYKETVRHGIAETAVCYVETRFGGSKIVWGSSCSEIRRFVGDSAELI